MSIVTVIFVLPFSVITIDKKDYVAFQTTDHRLDSRMTETVHWILNEKYLVDNRSSSKSAIHAVRKGEYAKFVDNVQFAKIEHLFYKDLLNQIDAKYSYFQTRNHFYGVDIDRYQRFIKLRDDIDSKLDKSTKYHEADLKHFAVVEGTFKRFKSIKRERSIGSVIQIIERDNDYLVLMNSTVRQSAIPPQKNPAPNAISPRVP